MERRHRKESSGRLLVIRDPEERPNLFADWLRARFFGMGDKSRYEFLLPILEEKWFK